MEKNCKNCIHYPCLRINCGKVCNQYKTEVQEILEGIDKILEEGYYDFERAKIGGNMFEVQLKFYNREWKNYFGKRKYNKVEALELFEKLVESFSNSQWRIVYMPEEEI